jgi:putative acetyltransferase
VEARIAPATGAEDVEIVRTLFHEYAATLEIDLEYQGFAAECASLPDVYAPPGGALLLVWVDASPAGCVGVRPLREGICEMKRLYVRPAYRGRRLGALLAGAAVRAARELGYRELWLDTLPTMLGAHKLYESQGFREIAPYGSAAPGSRFYGVRLVT